MKQISYALNETRVDLIDPKDSKYGASTFGVHFVNTTVKLVIDYDMVLDPPIISDEGGMQFSLEDLTFEGYFVPYFKDPDTLN